MADYRSIVSELFEIVPSRSTHDEIVFVCPQCNDKSGNRSVNVKTGLTNCWKCGGIPGHSGNFIKWCRRLGHNVEMAEMATITPTEADSLLNSVSDQAKFLPVIDIKFPTGFTRIEDDPSSGYAKLIGRMATRKGLTLDDMIKAGVGFTLKSYSWEPYAIFPVYEYGRLVYYQGRTYVDEPGKSTKKFPSRHECPYGMSYWVYNLDKVKANRPKLVVAVEAILNVLSLESEMAKLGRDDFVPVCVFKHSISEIQLRKLTSFKFVEEICVLYDTDSVLDAWAEVGSKIVGRSQRISIAKMKLSQKMIASGRKKADPNDDPLAAIESIDGRQTYSVANELSAILGSL